MLFLIPLGGWAYFARPPNSWVNSKALEGTNNDFFLQRTVRRTSAPDRGRYWLATQVFCKPFCRNRQRPPHGITLDSHWSDWAQSCDGLTITYTSRRIILYQLCLNFRDAPRCTRASTRSW